MAKLTKDQVLHVAKLAKLKLTDAEVDKYTSQLSSVLDYFSELSEVNIKDVEPTSQTTGLTNVFRDDEVVGHVSLTQDEVLSGTEETHNGYFKVKAVLEERTDK
jgi:aspartyl-tRNA(Asn)/glutamyl-tRNA(Gln) amidotransferase subunit C